MIPKMPLLCPSSNASFKGAAIIGVMKESGKVSFLSRPYPVDQEILQKGTIGEIGTVLRVAAQCEGDRCLQFKSGKCSLVTKLVQVVRRQEGKMPACNIRGTCVWWEQERIEACLRCSQIATKPSRGNVDIASLWEKNQAVSDSY